VEQDWSSLQPPGWSLNHVTETDSTNDLAKEAGLTGMAEKTLFVTDHQQRGRGRMDRNWVEIPGSSLLFSVLFRRQLSPMLLTMVCSVAACEGIQRVAGIGPEIKWPNDLILNGRKLAGVLTEVNWSQENPFAVVGMGINVNFDPPLVEGIPDTATSLLRETGVEVSRQELLREILVSLDAMLAMKREDLEPLARKQWVSRLWRRRQKVAVADGSTVLEGVFEDVDEEGVLLLRLDDGTLTQVRVGDLVI
jgi:BirA family transcriptional regulator, biotin operon repressor / biotin---[acetyl-CoA-carboxylase] ligase